jgi:hypothetical protein
VSAKEGRSGLPRPTIHDDLMLAREMRSDLADAYRIAGLNGEARLGALTRILDYVEHVAEEREAVCTLLKIGGDDPARWLEWADGRDGSMGPCGPFPLYEAIEAAVKPEVSP